MLVSKLRFVTRKLKTTGIITLVVVSILVHFSNGTCLSAIYAMQLVENHLSFSKRVPVVKHLSCGYMFCKKV